MLGRKPKKVPLPVSAGDTVELVLRCGRRAPACVQYARAGLVELTFRRDDARLAHVIVSDGALRDGQSLRWAFDAGAQAPA